MRFGLVLDKLPDQPPLAGLIAQARAAEVVGFDVVWLAESPALPSPAVAAAALAPKTSTLRVGIELQAGVNPVYLAEEAAVVDLCLGGRLVVSLRSEDSELLAETVDVLQLALAARPFRHDGRWRIPANLPENVVNREELIRVTPASAQLEVPVWLAGSPAAQVARERCLTFIGTAGESADSLTTEWQHTEARLGPAARRLRRVAVRDVATDTTGSLDDDDLVARLRVDQRGWGLDLVLVRLPLAASLAARVRSLDLISSRVMPRVQLDRLPSGLEQYWKQRQETAS
jgi:alkanesulfonate monooxygenase SsuD/methylene tetrahydromethanopterin reductase-like flavin-dependent oxidoreductase (luciferase family)